MQANVKMNVSLSGILVLLLVIALPSCNGGSGGNGDTDTVQETDAEENEPAAVMHTTLTRRLLPRLGGYDAACPDELERQDYCENPGPKAPDMRDYSREDLGTWDVTSGEEFMLSETLGVVRGEPGERRSLFTWAHFSDVHITDEESPHRLCYFDTKAIPSALRPADMYTEVVFDAAIRVINRFSALQPIGLVLITGDYSDSAQRNEIEDFITVLNGGAVDPDSGADDDPVSGPDNDPQDPFTAEGLDGVPWILTIGNHDTLYLGNWVIDEETRDVATGLFAEGGTRHGETYEIIYYEDIPAADPDRIMLYHNEMLQMFVDAPGEPQGHGFAQDNVDSDKGYYVYDPPNNAPVRFIVLDTANRIMGFDGDSLAFTSAVIDRDQYENFLIPALDQALTDKKLVIVASHHPSSKLQDDGFPERFITEEELNGTLKSYANVLIYNVGHSHENEIIPRLKEDGPGGFYQIQVSSLVDWPQQFRFFELVDNGNGTLSLFTVVVDHAGEEGGMTETARAWSLIDYQTGWEPGGPGVEPQDRNAELIFAVPAGFADAVANAPAGAKIQSLTHWQGISD